MAKRPLTAKQKAALAKGRKALAKARRGRKPNPLKSGYSTRTVSANVSELVRAGRTQAQATRIALDSARKSYRMKHPRGAFPSHIALTRTTRRRNPAPPTRGAVMAKDLPGMRRGLGRRLSTQQKVAKQTLRRYPQTTTRQQGFKENPPHYVLKGAAGYFDGAGFCKTKNGAAQYMTKQKAATIGQKIADKTGKPVAVVAV